MKDCRTPVTIHLREDNKRIVIRSWGKKILDEKNRDGIVLTIEGFRKNRRREDVFPDGAMAITKPSWVKKEIWDKLSDEEQKEEAEARS